MSTQADTHKITLTVNGTEHAVEVAARRHLADVLREEIGLTGTHLGCEHGVCGACTVAVDGAATRSCLVLAVQVDGSEITTIEGLTEADGTMGLIQKAMWDRHAFQCAFCAPGVMMSVATMLAENPEPTREEIKEGLSGNLCRCTGYHSILEGVNEAVAQLSAMKRERASRGTVAGEAGGVGQAQRASASEERNERGIDRRAEQRRADGENASANGAVSA